MYSVNFSTPLSSTWSTPDRTSEIVSSCFTTGTDALCGEDSDDDDGIAYDDIQVSCSVEEGTTREGEREIVCVCGGSLAGESLV